MRFERSAIDGARWHMPLAALPPELVRLVIKAISDALDATTLERLGGTDGALLALCREPAFWRPLLAAHFDGIKLPPELSAGHPRAHLREIVTVAQALTQRQQSRRTLQLPDRSKALDAIMNAPDFEAWRSAMDERITASNMRPVKFCPGQLQLVSYGKFVRATMLRTVMKHAGGVTAQEATMAGWLKYEPATFGEVSSGYDTLSPWAAEKMTVLAANNQPGDDPGATLEEDVRALVTKHGLPSSAVERMLAAARNELREELYEDEEEDDDTGVWCIAQARLPRPVAATKLLAGFYGGIFAYEQPIGSISSTLTCLSDGKRCSYNDEELAW